MEDNFKRRLQKKADYINLQSLLNKKRPVSTACSSGKKDFLKGRLAALFF
jgi:hypothetical protein